MCPSRGYRKIYITEDPYADIELMVNCAVNWQIKETPDNSLPPRIDMKKLVTIIRRGGYRGFLPIETLPMGRKDYDSFGEAAKMLTALNRAVQETA